MEVVQAAEQLAQVVERVNRSYRPVVLEEAGREVGAILPIVAYRTLVAERESRFQALEDAVAKQLQYPEDEVDRDIAEALAAVRRERRALDGAEPPKR